MSSALLNRMFHVELRADSRIWLEWAAGHGIHPYVYDYICFRPDQLWSQPSKTEEPFSSPRSWHMLSDAIISYGDSISEQELAVLANGCLTAAHAAQFVAYVRQVRQAYSITKIINGTQNWPDEPEERDVLYFLAQSFRAQLLKELPHNRSKLTSATQTLTLRAKELLVELACISLEIAQMAITPEDGETLPAWFIVEVTRDLPARAKKRKKRSRTASPHGERRLKKLRMAPCSGLYTARVYTALNVIPWQKQTGLMLQTMGTFI